jgi:hypothetical protein
LAAELGASASDEADGEGISLAEPIVPGLISSNTPAQANPFVADRVILGAPSTGG